VYENVSCLNPDELLLSKLAVLLAIFQVMLVLDKNQVRM